MRLTRYQLLLPTLLVLSHALHAETYAEKVFGTWERVSIEEIKRYVPEYQYERVSLGSVTNEYKPKPEGTSYCTLGMGYVGNYPCPKSDK